MGGGGGKGGGGVGRGGIQLCLISSGCKPCTLKTLTPFPEYYNSRFATLFSDIGGWKGRNPTLFS